jgi:hypothetical protein
MVRENLGYNQQERQNREHDLNRLRPPLFGSDPLCSPLRCRSRSQGPYSPYDVKVENGPKDGDSHHRNADFVGMNGKYKSGNERSSRQRTQPNEQSKAADRHYRSTRTLQQDKEEAR